MKFMLNANIMEFDETFIKRNYSFNMPVSFRACEDVKLKSTQHGCRVCSFYTKLRKQNFHMLISFVKCHPDVNTEWNTTKISMLCVFQLRVFGCTKNFLQ